VRLVLGLLSVSLFACTPPESADDGASPQGEPPESLDDDRAGASPGDAPAASSDTDGATQNQGGAGSRDAGTPTSMEAGARDASDVAARDAGGAAATDASTIADASAPNDAAAPVDAAWPRLETAQIGAPKRVAGGYSLAESPLWDHCQKRLLYPDVNASVIHQLSSDGKVSNFMTSTYYANGLAFDVDGSLLMAQMGGGRGGRVARRNKDGTVQVLVDKDPRGQPFHTIDDLVVRSDGTIYFTDGDFPHGPYIGFTILGELALYVLKPGQPMRMLSASHMVRGPNGVELSPDEQTLYLSSYFSERIVKLKVAADGSLSTPTTFASSLPTSDSFCLDAAGNVYSAISTGIQVLRPDASRVKLIPITTTDGATNCGFGGEDGKTLFITGWTDLWKVENMPIPGLDWQKNRSLPCDP
jgi:gluconolactonase